MIKVYVKNQPQMSIKWGIFKGGRVKEDLRGAKLYLWLQSCSNRLPLDVEIGEDKCLYASVPEGLEAGLYGLKAVWFKDADRPDVIAKRGVAEVDDVILVDSLDRGYGYAGTEDITIGVESDVNTSYGYDGLDAYELSVIRGKTTLSEEDWLQKINSGGTGKEYSIVTGKWELSFEINKNVADPEGEIIGYTCNLTRNDIKVYLDGSGRQEVVPVPGVPVLTANAEDVSFVNNTIVVGASVADRTIVVQAASSDGSVSMTKMISQGAAASLEITAAVDATGTDVLKSAEARVIECYDDAVFISLRKTGSVSSYSVASDKEWAVASVEADGRIKVALTANNTSSERSAKLTITYNGKILEIDVKQTGVTATSYSTGSVNLSYTQYSADATEGGEMILSVGRRVVLTRTNGKISTYTDNSYKSLAFTDTKGYVNATTGALSYTTKNKTTSRVEIDSVSVVVTFNDDTTISKTGVKVYQGGATLYNYYGKITKAIGNWNDAAGATISAITAAKVKAAMNAGLIQSVSIVKLDAPKSVACNKMDYVVCLIPTDASFNAYKWQQYDGVNNPGLAASWVDFKEKTNYFTNGGVTLEIDGINYKMYCQYVGSDNTNFDLINYK